MKESLTVYLPVELSIPDGLIGETIGCRESGSVQSVFARRKSRITAGIGPELLKNFQAPAWPWPEPALDTGQANF